MYYHQSTCCAIGLALALACEIDQLHVWKYALPTSDDCHMHSQIEIRRAQNYALKSATDFNRGILSVAKKLQFLRTEEAAPAWVKKLTSPPPIHLRRGCLRQERRVRFADEKCTKDTKSTNQEVVRFQEEVKYFSRRSVWYIHPLMHPACRILDFKSRIKMTCALLSDLASSVVVKVLTRRMDALEASIGEEEMLRRRLVQANKVASRKLVNKTEKQFGRASRKMVDPRVREVYLDLWDEEVDKRGRKCQFNEIVKVKDISRVYHIVDDGSTDVNGLTQVQREEKDLYEKLGEYEMPLKKKSEHNVCDVIPKGRRKSNIKKSK